MSSRIVITEINSWQIANYPAPTGELYLLLQAVDLPGKPMYAWNGTAWGPTNPAIKGYTNRVPQFIGGQKPFNNFTGASDGGTFSHTGFLKMEAEAPFSAVRLWVTSWIAAFNGVLTAIVAPTETMSRASAAIAYIPQVGGVAKNTVLAAPFSAAVGGVEYGHRNVTWAGAANFAFSAPTPGPTHADPLFKASDWIACRSVPRVDVSGTAALRHAAMARLFNNGGNRSIQDFTSYYAADLAQPWFRDIQGGVFAGDGVGTPANIPAAAPGTVANNASYTMWLEFMYDAPTRHVINVGNSRQDTWPRRILQYSTPTAPIAYTEMAFPGDDSLHFFTAYDNMVAQGLGQFTDVILQGYDINTVQSSIKTAAEMINRYMAYIKKFRDQGARIFITTDFANNTFNATNELARQTVMAWIRNICANGVAILVDTDPLISDYTVPATPSIKAIYNVGDNTHITVAGEDLIWTQAFQPVWVANS